jgi:hypothetical protein
MAVLADLTGRIFGRLTVMSEYSARTTSGKVRWECACRCGRIITTVSGDLNSGNTQSCGCLKIEMIQQIGLGRVTHGMKGTPEYSSWRAMKNRCYRQSNNNYKDYGGRGITVCDRWLNSFEAFYEDMGPRPSLKYSIERRENNGNYEKSNCYWATDTEQANNKRNNILYEYGDEKLTLSEISVKTGISYDALYQRINKAGLSIAQAAVKR